jgi:hypothetical protein
MIFNNSFMAAATLPERLFVPVVNVIADDVDHDRASWGIRFPLGAASFDLAAVDVIEYDLEGGGDAMLDAGLQGLDLAAVLFAVVAELDGEFVEHTIEFRKGPPGGGPIVKGMTCSCCRF